VLLLICQEKDMNRSHDALTLQMLDWIAHGTHSYAEVLDVWKAHALGSLSGKTHAPMDWSIPPPACPAWLRLPKRGKIYFLETGPDLQAEDNLSNLMVSP
jgi:hypothetical protein